MERLPSGRARRKAGPGAGTRKGILSRQSGKPWRKHTSPARVPENLRKSRPPACGAGRRGGYFSSLSGGHSAVIPCRVRLRL